MLINDNFSTESELKQTLDFIYARSKEGKSLHGLLEIIAKETTITTAIHNIKSNKGAYTPGLDKKDIDFYLQMPKEKLVHLVQKTLTNYHPKPVKRIYILKSNGKKRPLGIPPLLERIIQECIRIVIEPVAEARFYPHSYGFRPFRSCKHAIAQICYTINHGGRNKPIYAIEGDIKGFFDNVNHRTLLNKLFNIGVHDKRVIAIVKKMLKAGYFEEGNIFNTEKGTPQGSILSPLLGNIYLNSFDWTVGRMYQEPKRQDTDGRSAREELRNRGIITKYHTRYADDWIILTQTEQEAKRLLGFLKKYFKIKLKLELSEDKTVITNLTEKPAKFLGFLIKIGKPRPRPDNIGKRKLYPKVYPNPEKVHKKVSEICTEIKELKHCNGDKERAVFIEKINSIIVGAMEYWKISICSNTYKHMDNVIYKSAFAAFKRMYPETYTEHRINTSDTGNRLTRHGKSRTTRTWAIKLGDTWIGITKAYMTKYQRLWYPYNQRKTPYTMKGRKLVMIEKRNAFPLDRPSLYDPISLEYCVYRQGIYNFEYYMNREYAYNRDKGKCRLCGDWLLSTNRHCHHTNNGLEINMINKVSNLAWMHDTCHRMVHSNQNYENILQRKVHLKLISFREKLAK